MAAKDDQLWIVSARCTSCRHQQMFWVTLRDGVGQSVLRDVSDEEEEHFAAMEEITGDEVLDMHLFLADFDGDFKRLFGS